MTIIIYYLVSTRICNSAIQQHSLQSNNGIDDIIFS